MLAKHKGWVAPVVILLIIVGLILAARHKREAVENPLVDIAILTVGVFAFAWVFRVAGAKLGSPGLAAFFGAPPVPANHPSVTAMTAA